MSNLQNSSAAMAGINLVVAIVESVGESDDSVGLPSGPLYATLMQTGLSLRQYTLLMQSLCNAGLLTCSNHCYRITDKGRKWLGPEASNGKRL